MGKRQNDHVIMSFRYGADGLLCVVTLSVYA